MTDSSLPKPTAPKLPQPSSQNMIDDHSTVSSGGLSPSTTPALASFPGKTANLPSTPTVSAPVSNPSVPGSSIPNAVSAQVANKPVISVPSAPQPMSPIGSTPVASVKPLSSDNGVTAAVPPIPVKPASTPIQSSSLNQSIPGSVSMPSATSPLSAKPSSPPSLGATPAPMSPKPASVPVLSTPPTSVPSQPLPLAQPKPIASSPPLSPAPRPLGTLPSQPQPTVVAPAVNPTQPVGGVKPIVGAPKPLTTAGQPSFAPKPLTPAAPVAPAAQPTAPAGTKPAEPKKSILRFLPFVLIGVVLLAIVGGIAAYFLNTTSSDTETPIDTKPVTNKKTIEYWGLWESTGVMDEVLSDFENENNVDVKYVQQSHKEYRERLQTAIASEKGPDLFRFHASWTPMLKTELSPLPEKIMTPTEFAAAFYPVATTQLTVADKLVGIPLMYEGLGLYYNTDIFSVANKTVPQDWEELKDTASDLTIRSGTTISRGGIALGTTENVEHFSDILGLMMLQNGADPADPSSPAGQDALAFYTSFANTLKVWDSTLPSATTAFARGDVAMMIAPSWRVHEIKTQNPQLNFAVAPVPQLPSSEKVTWASYWAEGVNAQSKNKELSWKLIEYLSSTEIQKKMYSEAKKERAFGPLYSRMELAAEVVNDPYVGAYFQDAPYAKNWYLNAFTHDNGLNDRSIKYYQDAINAGTTNAAGLATVKQGITQVLQQYGLVAAPPAVVE